MTDTLMEHLISHNQLFTIFGFLYFSVSVNTCFQKRRFFLVHLVVDVFFLLEEVLALDANSYVLTIRNFFA